ncbi:hypothetical protein [Paraburkholderia unamae]|uniref:Uncharacterized protein n=1 Tax=Paraburkholderia unamae TaxID=219649 RepID=A0ACC6RR34_9BURK
MVTYPTIDELVTWKRQRVFDHVAAHLLEQGERSTKGSTRNCMYRDGRGHACAIGAVVPESVYDPAMEGKGITALEWFFAAPQFSSRCYTQFREFLYQHAALLIRLLQIHDEVKPLQWPEALIDLAESMMLETRVVYTYKARVNQASHDMPEPLKEVADVLT